jgi:hypothetical protein
MKKTPLEQLSFWIEQFQRINGTPSLEDIKGQIELLKDYEKEQLELTAVSQQRELLIDFCAKLELKTKQYSYLIPDDDFIDEYLKGN